VDAFELIYREYPDATLTIVGPEWVAPREHIADLCLERDVVARLAPFYEGSYLSHLKARLSKEALNNVTFVGLVSHRSIPNYYAASDIYVSPSLYESFGMSIIEAMAAGVPVVAARGGAVADLVSDRETGLVVDSGNPAALAAALMGLFSNPGLRSSIASEALRQVRQFSWETICSALMQLYCEASMTGNADITKCGPAQKLLVSG
jgi:glycosyltransferase involved in cell wall biosynthesis